MEDFRRELIPMLFVYLYGFRELSSTPNSFHLELGIDHYDCTKLFREIGYMTESDIICTLTEYEVQVVEVCKTLSKIELKVCALQNLALLCKKEETRSSSYTMRAKILEATVKSNLSEDIWNKIADYVKAHTTPLNEVEDHYYNPPLNENK